MKQSYVYIMTSKKEGVLYIGVTSDLKKRLWQHKQKEIEGFTKKYNVDKLVYFEVFEAIEEAILREKRLKKYLRHQKIALIEQSNPDWDDLSETIMVN